ncbi:hypothetical protein A8708_02450 [Paenibacillus oryzisoli]|uniref:DUF559 domain-containing protein n=2 Tax=Paenibacillus oryzisoli TaxID=1850517 RepID=A0A198A804_9BACL|nr:hypothetical protein A8708_02450 [Paenibacillus oryzisoli]
MQEHTKKRKGERLRRLLEGHGHAERLFLKQVWWRALGDFLYLHPEFEVKDFRDGTRFIDFAYIRQGLKLAIEIDGYSTHASQISRTQFSDSLTRQNHLIIDGWKVLRFSYDDIKNHPRMCEQIILQFIGKYFSDQHGGQEQIGELSIIEQTICRLALSYEKAISPRYVSEYFQFGIKKSRNILHEMMEKELLLSAGVGQQRIRYYRLHPAVAARMVR